MADFLGIQCCMGKVCFFLPQSAAMIWKNCSRAEKSAASVWPSNSKAECFNLTRAFSSQGDLFVFCAKSPLRGDSCFRFFISERSASPKAAAGPLPPPPALHTLKRLLISWDKRFIKERNGAMGFLGESEKQWRKPTSHDKMKEKDSDSFWGFAWLIRHVDSSCFLDGTTASSFQDEGWLSI